MLVVCNKMADMLHGRETPGGQQGLGPFLLECVGLLYGACSNCVYRFVELRQEGGDVL